MKNKLEKLVFVNRLFSGKIGKEKKCTGCGHISNEKEDFFYLNLALQDGFSPPTKSKKRKQTKVIDCLNRLFCSETREGIECDNCNSRNDCVYKTTISELPNILIVYFLRNSYSGKITDDLDIGLTH